MLKGRKGDQLASALDDQTVVVWNVASGEQVLTLKGHTRPVNSIAWSSSEQASMLEGHTRPVNSVAWGQGDQRSLR